MTEKMSKTIKTTKINRLFSTLKQLDDESRRSYSSIETEFD